MRIAGSLLEIQCLSVSHALRKQGDPSRARFFGSANISAAYCDALSCNVQEGGVHYRFFDVMVDPKTRRYLSEDYGFCRLWEKIGGEMYVDANSNLTHSGERLYTGDFGATLRSALPTAVGAPKGQRIQVTGLSNLKPNPR
jgi:hypothetical protein